MKLILASIASLALLGASSVALAESATTKVISFDTHATYVEVGVANTVCAGLTGSWGRKLRVVHSDAGRAEFTAKIALAALLSGKSIYVDTSVSGGRCMIEAIQIQ